jgi:hypothetical protein
MCRHPLYFRGLHKLSMKWEEEKIEKMNQEAFNEAFEAIFEEPGSDWHFPPFNEDDDDEEDDNDEWEPWTDSDSDDWETSSETEPREQEPRVHVPYSFSLEETESESDIIMKSIIKLQQAYHRALKSGIDIPMYLEDENYLFFNIDEGDSKTFWLEDDVFPHTRNLFVSKHKGMINNKRTGSRVATKTDTMFTIVIVVEC